MSKIDLEKEGLTSLNSELNELCLQQLEDRLETDPLAVGGLLDIAASDGSISPLNTDECTHCSGDVNCNSHQCL